MKKGLLDVQFRAIAIYGVNLYETTTAARIKNGPAKAFLNQWLKRPTANYSSPRLSGVLSDLSKENILRQVGMNGAAPIYTKGENFDSELEKVFDYLYNHDAIGISTGDDGEIELSVDSELIYIPLENLYEMFENLGYFEMQGALLYKE